jgi:uncharacterized membrane protein YphA (DoxX/SURF4 family)
MFVVTIILAVLLALAFGTFGAQKIAGAKRMMDSADHLGFSHGSYKVIGVLELLGAIGLLVGLAVWPLGVAAAAGLVLLMAGAVISHVRNGDKTTMFAPALLLGLVALVELAFRVTSA